MTKEEILREFENDYNNYSSKLYEQRRHMERGIGVVDSIMTLETISNWLSEKLDNYKTEIKITMDDDVRKDIRQGLLKPKLDEVKLGRFIDEQSAEISHQEFSGLNVKNQYSMLLAKAIVENEDKLRQDE